MNMYATIDLKFFIIKLVSHTPPLFMLVVIIFSKAMEMYFIVNRLEL